MGGDLYEVIEDVEKVDDEVDRIFIEEFQFAHQDIFSDQEYGTVEHIVSTYGFIFGRRRLSTYGEKRRRRFGGSSGCIGGVVRNCGA